MPLSRGKTEGGRKHFEGAARPSSLISVRHGATGIVLPVAVLIIESRRIADRRSVSVGRINADTESKAGTVVSAAAVISSAAIVPATAIIGATAAIGVPAIEVSAEVPA